MQSEAKFERIRHQRDDAASRFEIDIGDLALPICPRQRAGFPPQHSTHPLRKQILKRGLGLEELSRSTLMELTLTTNTIRGNPRSQLEGDGEGRSKVPLGVIPVVACAPSFAVFGEDGRGEERSAVVKLKQIAASMRRVGHKHFL